MHEHTSHDDDGDERPSRASDADRGEIQLVDAILGTLTTVALVVTAPIWMEFTNMVTAEADPFTSVLLQLAFPLLVLALIMSVGVSARRGGV